MPPDRALYDVAALRALEQRATQALGDDFVLMQRAGDAAWRELLAHWAAAQCIVVVCGPGTTAATVTSSRRTPRAVDARCAWCRSVRRARRSRSARKPNAAAPDARS